MPRKPSSSHPLKQIRETAGLTQEHLAKWLGVSKSTIQSVEINRLALSRPLATKIVRQLGCGLSSRTDKTGKERYDVLNISRQTHKTYTKEDFKAHRESMEMFDEEALKDFFGPAARCIELLFRAAHRHGGGTAMALREDFESFAADAFSNYGLAPYLKGILKEEWVPHDQNLDADVKAANFPLAPLSTSSALPTSTEIELARCESELKALQRDSRRSKRGSKSDAKVMP